MDAFVSTPSAGRAVAVYAFRALVSLVQQGLYQNAGCFVPASERPHCCVFILCENRLAHEMYFLIKCCVSCKV